MFLGIKLAEGEEIKTHAPTEDSLESVDQPKNSPRANSKEEGGRGGCSGVPILTEGVDVGAELEEGEKAERDLPYLQECCRDETWGGGLWAVPAPESGRGDPPGLQWCWLSICCHLCQKTRLGFRRLIDAVLPESADGSGNGGKESQVMSTSMMGAISQVLAHLQAIKHLDEETPVSGID